MKFFSLDSPFHKYGTIAFDMIAMNFFWLFTSLLIFTPAANAALFHSIYHVIVEEEGYMARTYFSTYRKKFLKGLGLSVISFVLFGICYFNLTTVLQIPNIPYIARSILRYFYFMITFEVTITILYATALLGETDMSIKQLMKYGFLLSNKHLFTSILCVAIILLVFVSMAFTQYMMIIICIGIAPTFWLLSLLIHKRCFSQYYLDKLV